MKTWIVVAQRDGARFFEWATRSEPLRLVEELAHAEGRLKNGEIDSDAASATYGSSSVGSNATAREVPATEHLAIAFAKVVVQHIEQARMQHRFERLVLVSGPRFLGHLRDGLSHSTRELLKHEIVKNLGHANAEEVRRYVDAELFLPVHP